MKILPGILFAFFLIKISITEAFAQRDMTTRGYYYIKNTAYITGTFEGEGVVMYERYLNKLNSMK
jgi:hypothetical protein